MTTSGDAQLELVRWRHAWAWAVAGITGLLTLWIPVGHRAVVGTGSIDLRRGSATAPGLVFAPGDQSHASVVRLAAIFATLAVVTCAVMTFVALRRRSEDAAVIAIGGAAVNVLASLGLLAALRTPRTFLLARGDEYITLSSGLVLFALLPVVLAVVAAIDSGFSLEPPRRPSRPE